MCDTPIARITGCVSSIRIYVGDSPYNYSVDTKVNRVKLVSLCAEIYILLKMKIHSSCEIEDFVKNHLCKLCVIVRSRVLRVVCPH